uniref:Sosondowah ankyrin repeat domain family member Ab n=1 Tax=Oryzias melastigma TaxID=30732 RepID=A0A3B3BL11_ORYME
MALTQESLLTFLLERGGKVKNSELLNSFKSLFSCSDPAEKQHNRDRFKALVNSVAVVKQIDGVKFVVVKKRYQDFVKDVAPNLLQQMDRSGSGPAETLSESSFCQKIDSDAENNNVMVQKGGPSNPDFTTVKILNICGDQAGKSGAVFALVAVKSPPRDLHEPPHQVQRSCSDYRLDSSKRAQCWRSEVIDNTPRQAEEATDSVPLEPLAHEWLVKCAAGLWGHIHALLLRDTRLAQKRDFMSGFTALHWAAKDGNCGMIQELMAVSRKRGTFVNTKSHGGYTPLHIAAMHGHTEVMVLLVQRYRASISERDNDGRKAVHYLEKSASMELRALLGGQDKTDEEEEEYKGQAKSFNTISKLFHPHMGKKKEIKRLYTFLEQEKNKHDSVFVICICTTLTVNTKYF